MKLIPSLCLAAMALSTAACTSQGKYPVQFAQERQACATVGYDPGGAQFTQCVANLDDALSPTID